MDKKQKEYLNKMTRLMLDSGFDLKMLDMMQGYLPKVSIIIHDNVTSDAVEYIVKGYYFPELVEVTNKLDPSLDSDRSVWPLLTFTTDVGDARVIHAARVLTENGPVSILSMTDYGNAKDLLDEIASKYSDPEEDEDEEEEDDEDEVSFDHPELDAYKAALPIQLDDMYRRYASNYEDIVDEYGGHEFFVDAISRFIENSEYINAVIEQLQAMINDEVFSQNEKKEFKSLFYDLMEYTGLAAAFTACEKKGGNDKCY